MLTNTPCRNPSAVGPSNRYEGGSMNTATAPQLPQRIALYGPLLPALAGAPPDLIALVLTGLRAWAPPDAPDIPAGVQDGGRG